MSQSTASNLKAYAFRLTPHQDVKKAIMRFAQQNKIKAGSLMSAVGSLEKINLRYANEPTGTMLSGHYEVVSLTGTFSETSAHIHMSVADGSGKTLGGHLLDENLVYTTLELVVADVESIEFIREKDSTYGYEELVVKPRSKAK